MTIDEAIAYVRKTYYEGGAGNALANEVERLRAENNTLRLELHEWSKRELELKDARDQAAELDWFRRRESEFGPGDFHAFPSTYGRYQDWLKHNPKPGAGT